MKFHNWNIIGCFLCTMKSNISITQTSNLDIHTNKSTFPIYTKIPCLLDLTNLEFALYIDI